MKRFGIATILFVLAVLPPAYAADDPPNFYTKTYPEYALKSRLQAESVLMGKSASISVKTRELIALAVAAQIPCAYCIYVHTKNARAEGAKEVEIKEAVAIAAHVRHWSTVLNGMAYDLNVFKKEVDDIAARK